MEYKFTSMFEQPNDLIGDSHFRVVGVNNLRKLDHDGKKLFFVDIDRKCEYFWQTTLKI